MKMYRTSLGVALWAFLAIEVAAQIPRTLSYQGVLADSSGRPKPDGVYSFTFRLYTVSSGGTAIWSEAKSLQVKRGLFSTTLGDVTPIPQSIAFDRQYWLGTQVAPNPELPQRTALTAAGYSFNSLRSDTARYALSGAGGGTTDSARIAGSVANNSITSANIQSGQVVKSLNGVHDAVIFRAQGGATLTSNGDTITINSGSGGGGTGIQGVQNTNNTLDITNPNGPTATVNLKAPLTMDAATSFGPVLKVRNTQTNGGNAVEGITQGYIGVYGESQGTYGVYGLSKNVVSGVGVYGATDGSSNASAGVWGEGGYHGVAGYSFSSAAGASGVYGEAANAVGVLGFSYLNDGVVGSSSVANRSGVWGHNDVAGGVGVSGSSVSGDGVRGSSSVANRSGVWGRNDVSGGVGVLGSSTDGIGVYGSSANGFAGYFEGKISVTSMDIRGGSDIAEPFSLNDDLEAEPGTLLVIDEGHPGKLKVSTSPYDTKVAGVISGAGGIKPGVQLHQDGLDLGNTNVAIAGRVYCKADASSEPINPGDLLTTSGSPGYAMKATDRHRSHGAVIGKAMTGLKQGKGLVLVLVNLQ